MSQITVTDDKETNETLKDDKLYWENLTLARKEASDEVLKQQTLFTSLLEQYKSVIEADEVIKKKLTGMIFSLNDIAKTIVLNSLEHALETKEITVSDVKHTVPVKFKQGEITKTEDELDYIRIAGAYIGLQEKTAYIVSVNYLDIFADLKINPNLPEYKELKAVKEKIEHIEEEVGE